MRLIWIGARAGKAARFGALDGHGSEYEENLTRFIQDIRATFGANLLFVLSKLSPNQGSVAARERMQTRMWRPPKPSGQTISSVVFDGGYGGLYLWHGEAAGNSPEAVFDNFSLQVLDAAEQGLTYDVQANASLLADESWSTNGIAETSGTVDDEFELVTNRISTADADAQFMQLTVEAE